ncbi:hypothetical protein CcaverHIS002_0109900 [Cutaneotrichosporon cavernicola]|uniref:Conserved oligomeric Golgi complex subunit 7 n=1 Tax=Cutaneotrichosporon cavernicola TaxID=279322 RepID=A0AA48KXG7_9TREE|nr:uncharacterized protein CcaverHIS019_0109820 [Cutaneotrichosporon cavernicola]BEI80461.1 hypothetical protein CcaverHIS002_0109900 [Cutaneotrichosporon cavernicola]BEI88264.1 hypothetical protein CcaverHIS019_0109820 [Cutaneotrichosporon cavernicola]BEI96036.1 hypothetical protein CcaverHIS631_0109850 [Cutaneotrichosporon cavernicola]BEJ03809.1 hypothetical protein CcaverHIS641_0109840 [Cutaneotrichosporon cavernicola]
MASAAAGEPAVVDLTDPPLLSETPDPLTSLGALASALDCYDDDVPAFLNTILAPHLAPALPSGQMAPDLGPIDRQLTELLTRLSLLSQDTSSALEQSIHDISRNVPRLTYDLQFMRESAVSLQSSLHLVQDRVARQAAPAEVEGDEARTHRALERLGHLDKLKTRMESARDILAEAESWSTLEGEITSLVAEKSWTKAGERLAEAAKSLRVFQSAEGEYESKSSLLVSLQNELETALSAALKDAIARVDTRECASFHDVFRMMDRGSEFQNYYFAARRAPISKAWAEAVLSDADDPSSEEDGVLFATFLPRFYATVLTTLNAEKAQIAAIFPAESTANVLGSFFQAALDDLSPSMDSRLSAIAEYHGAQALPELIRTFKATEEFGHSVQGVMDKLSGLDRRVSHVSGSLSPAGPASPAARSRREPSLSSPSFASPHPRHMSVSHRFSRTFSFAPEVSSPTGWESSLYEPFLDLQVSYPSMEKKYLGYLLANDPPLNGEISEENPARTLTSRATTLFALAEDAVGRCVAFTHGYGALGLLDALAGTVAAFLGDNKGIIESARAAARRGAGHDTLDLEGLDYSPQDWGAFQLGMHVLEACQDVRDRLESFERRLYTALAGIGPTLAVTPADGLMFQRTDTTLGAITLIQQSTLNSVELHSLISGLSGDAYPLPAAHEALSSFTSSAQVFLQSIILRPLQSHLDAYPALSVWSQPEKPARRGELAIPSFSLSPTDTILRVSEGLLNLLRVFEVYAADDALAFSIETLPFVDVDSLRELLAPKEEERPSSAVGSGQASPGPTTAVTSLAAATKPTLTPEAVLSTWVSSLALSLLSSLTRTTLPAIRTLTAPGAAQLTSDLTYLSNAVRALDVEWEDLERWREAAECKDEGEWRRRSDGKGAWVNVGRLRSWTA